jgi:hypothetical protein
MTLQEISRQHQAHLRRFALYLAEEFSGSKAGEWRCPMIGTEAAVGVVEAIDALLASLVIPQEQERQAKKMTISYELEGRCLWHLECETNPLRCSPMFVVATEPTRSLVECTSCKQRGYYPVGGLGPLCCVVVIPQEVNTSAERVSETAKSEHVDQPNGSVDGLGVNSTARKETT